MKAKYFVILTLGLLGFNSFGHVQIVHQAITVNAAASALNGSAGFTNFLNVVASDIVLNDATNYMVEGSYHEDDADKGDLGGKRSYNHFYDPITGLGMSDFPPDLRVMTGTNSFTWASTYDCPGLNFQPKILTSQIENIYTINVWSWQNAREYELAGLTAGNPDDRAEWLTNMFRAVGQVMHLLQDTSQPQHTRNEQHLDVPIPVIGTPWISPIETYGKTNLATLNFQQGMLDWKNAGFTKLEDFWNRHYYNGTSSQPLDDDAGGDPTAQLGLAEFSNGNFLGARHLFPEYFRPGDIQYYPFPSRDHSTDYQQVSVNPLTGLDTESDGTKGIYIKKTGDGVVCQHLCRINYLGLKLKNLGLTGSPYCTIASSLVLKDYHDILIPKAVEYSAGLIDYFFRGNISVGWSWDTNEDGFDLAITNNSGQPLSGGQFQLFYDDDSGKRTQVPDYDVDFSQYENSLANGDGFEAIFYPPEGVTNCALVYQGTIGTNADGSAADPVDGGIAIAAQSFDPTAITTDDPLPDGLLCLDYSVQLEQVGLDTNLVEWSVIDGSLPDGLELDAGTGIISGTPTTEGQYEFTVEVTDGMAVLTKYFELNTRMGVDGYCPDSAPDVYIHADQAASLMSCAACSYQAGSPQNFDMDFVYGYEPCSWVSFAPGNQIQHDGGGYSDLIFANIVGWQTTCGQTYFTMLITCDGLPNGPGTAIWYGVSGYQDTPVGVYTKTFDCSSTGPDTITVSADP